MRLLVPIDEHSESEQALAVARRLASEPESEIILVTIGEVGETSEHAEDAREALQRRLDEVQERMSGFNVRTRIELAGDPVDGILAVAREEAADRIVIAREPRSRWDELVDRSVSDELVEEAGPVRVITVEGDQFESGRRPGAA